MTRQKVERSGLSRDEGSRAMPRTFRSGAPGPSPTPPMRSSSSSQTTRAGSRVALDIDGGGRDRLAALPAREATEDGLRLRDYLAGDTIRSSDGAGTPLTRTAGASRPTNHPGAVIGCGNHSRGVLQPNLARLPHYTTSLPATWTRLQPRIAPDATAQAVYTDSSGC